MGVPKTRKNGIRGKEVFLLKHVKLDEKQEEKKNGNADNCNYVNCCHAAHWKKI